MTSVRIWPRCRFGVRFRVWAPKVSGLRSLGWFVAQAEPWKGRRRCREGAQGERERGTRTHQSLMCCGGAPPLSGALWSLPVRARQGFTSPHTRILSVHEDMETHTYGTHPHHMGFLLLPAPPPAHAGPCKPCRGHACPRLRTKLPGFASPAPNYRCNWAAVPVQYPGRPPGWCCP